MGCMLCESAWKYDNDSCHAARLHRIKQTSDSAAALALLPHDPSSQQTNLDLADLSGNSILQIGSSSMHSISYQKQKPS